MDSLQNLTSTDAKIAKPVVKDAESKDDWRHLAWIDYRALNGTIITYDENAKNDRGEPAPREVLKKMTMQELADKLKVSRQTLYDWEDVIPDFWGKVRKRKVELAGQRRLSFMEDKFYMTAMTWKVPMISLEWMRQNSPDWVDPRIKHEHEVDENVVDLFKKLEDAKQRKVIDIDASKTESDT